MAAVWSQTLLKEIRSRTVQHGSMIEQIVGEICDWADGRLEATARRSLLAAQQELIRDRIRQLGEVGEDAVEELKDAVKRQLVEQITLPIRTECERFVSNGDAYGPGVKLRIVELFQQLSRQAVSVAAKPAGELLKARFLQVHRQIMQALLAWGDPLQQAADTVVEREEVRQRRSDALRRSKVLEEVNAVRQSMPRPPLTALAA